MKLKNDMRYPKSIMLGIVTVLVMVSITIIDNAYAQISAKSIGFEETTIIEFKNDGKSDVGVFRLWLGSDFNFKSFKTETGWTGKKTPEGVLVFTTSAPVKPGESVKFGIKTDKTKPGINWKALDQKENQLEIGKTLVSEALSEIPSSQVSEKPKPTSATVGNGILEKSVFRLIPEKPNAGGTVRIVGEAFAANHKLDLYLDDIKLETIQTNDDGHFMMTTKIPVKTAERVNFIVKDKQGNDRTVSIRLLEGQDRMLKEQVVELAINNFPTLMHRGDVVIIEGIGSPGGTVSATIKNSDGKITTTNATSINSQGKWSYSTIIPLDSPLGEYTAEISDGKNLITKKWNVESSKKIQIFPIKVKFEQGEMIKFNGTVIPNQKLEVILENPLGVEVFSDVIDVDNSGNVSFEYPTDFTTLEGTYVLYSFQGKESNIALLGVGELPQVQLLAKMDKLNYKSGDSAITTINGPPSSTISLIIVDPSDKTKFSETITLDPDGKKEFRLDLSGYASGVYTLVVQRGNAQAAETFTVGLQTGSGKIEIRSTKAEYLPGSSILILGNSGTNILATISLIDPDGKIIKTKEVFTNKEGLLSESSFRVPSNAKPGTWTLRAESGSNFGEQKISVIPKIEEGLVVLVKGITDVPTLGKVLNIQGYGISPSQNVIIQVKDSEGSVKGQLSIQATGKGEFSVQWPIPKELSPGTYTVLAKGPFKSAETTFKY